MPYAALHPDCDSLTDPDAGDLARIAAESEKPCLIVFSWRFPDLRELGVLPARVRTIKISGAPRLTSLDGVERLAYLEEFVLMAPTGSSGSGRRIQVPSFAPLERLAHLKRLVLGDVRPEDLDLSPIMRMTHLREVDIGGVPEFGLDDYARLAASLPNARGRCLQPYVTITGVGFCSKCKGQSVILVGAPPRSRTFVCPRCNEKRLKAHVAKWEALSGRKFEGA